MSHPDHLQSNSLLTLALYMTALSNARMEDFQETLTAVRQAIDFVKQNPYPGSRVDMFLNLCLSQIEEAQMIARNADANPDSIRRSLANIKKVSLDIPQKKDDPASIDPIKAVLHGSRATIRLWCAEYKFDHGTLSREGLAEIANMERISLQALEQFDPPPAYEQHR